ncbi:hypothetical protein CJP74_07255 [Psittacicella melopsittaci]|uniref:Uncharacterized protein n=1 Tax=Psittacicella melopsittaci TaxID=2028576 RepID=A0A3A1XZK5_9GAMM|nr:iron-containing alcohol dehydrogenase [Psittacicella melopsittaci]RIY31462.1 hypothetical protein CJP74_07255 [Psittacicella melopsittaci]
MYNFSYYSPTRVEFGADKENQIGTYLKPFKVKKLLIVYASERVKENHTLARIEQSLEQAGIAYVEFGGLEFNSDLTKVQAAVALAKKEQVDGVLAVGGSTVLDYAKVIALGAVNELDFMAYADSEEKQEPSQALPIFAVMTLTTKGSLMNNFALIAGGSTTIKCTFTNELIIPSLAIINPALQATTPLHILTRNAVVSIVMSLESYLTADDHPQLTDNLVETNIKAIMRTVEALHQDPTDLRAHSEYAWANVLAGNGSTSFGIGDRSFPVIMLALALSEYQDLTLEQSLAITLPAWMSWWKDYKTSQFERFALEFFSEESPEAAIELLCMWFEKFSYPTKLPELSEADFEKLIDCCTEYAHNWGLEEIYSRENIREIFLKGVKA